ncbi:MAG: hypothetical protein ACLUSP_08410 [Christensenellales bacterium]
MAETYTIDICGRKEDLPVLALPSGVKIAFLIFTEIRILPNTAVRKSQSV